MDASEFFGSVISTYSRAQAIEDGVLVDVTPTAKEAGIALPTVVTSHVWAECVEVPPSLVGQQDEQGRLWDVVYMASMALRAAVRGGAKGDRLAYQLNVQTAKGRRTKRLVAVVGPGDNGEPVLTLMFPEDD
jgi:hypothetical protein